MLIYDLKTNTLDSKPLQNLQILLNLVHQFWKFSKNYGDLIATPLQYREKWNKTPNRK